MKCITTEAQRHGEENSGWQALEFFTTEAQRHGEENNGWQAMEFFTTEAQRHGEENSGWQRWNSSPQRHGGTVEEILAGDECI